MPGMSGVKISDVPQSSMSSFGDDSSEFQRTAAAAEERHSCAQNTYEKLAES